MSGQYDDILYLPHHISPTRPQMSMEDRAAQFSPFSALTGYDAAIRETGRLTDNRTELTDDELIALDRKYQMLMEQLEDEPNVRFICFQPDDRKAGGAYVTVSGVVKKVDAFERSVCLTDGRKIPMDDIVDIVMEESAVRFGK